MLHVHFQKIYWHQTRQGADLAWESSTLKFTWTFDHVSHMNFWSCDQLEVTCQIGKIISPLSPLSQDLWPLNLTGCWFRREVQNVNTQVVINSLVYLAIDWVVKIFNKIIKCIYLVVALSLIYCFFVLLFSFSTNWSLKILLLHTFFWWMEILLLPHLFCPLFHKLLKPSSPTYAHY